MCEGGGIWKPAQLRDNGVGRPMQRAMAIPNLDGIDVGNPTLTLEGRGSQTTGSPGGCDVSLHMNTRTRLPCAQRPTGSRDASPTTTTRTELSVWLSHSATGRRGCCEARPDAGTDVQCIL